MDSGERKQQILDASAIVFAEKGYFNASVSDIIEQAGIARGTFYLYFTGKRQVFTEILEQISASVENRIKGVYEGISADEVYANLIENVNRVFGFLIENPNLTKILLTQAPGLDAASTRQLDQAIYMLRDTIKRLLQNGKRYGVLWSFNEDLVATVLLGGLKELLYQIVVTGDIDAPIEPLVEQIVLVHSRGILSPAFLEKMPENFGLPKWDEDFDSK